MQINIDVEALLAASLTAEKLAPVLDKHIGDAIKSAISDATGYSSPFRKKLAEQVAEALPHGLALDDAVKFQHCLNQSLRSALQGFNNDAVQTALDEVARDVLPDVKPVLKLSEFMTIARDGLHKEEHEAFYAYWEPSEYSSGGGWLYLDSDEDVGSSTYSYTRGAEGRKYSASYRLAVNGDGCVYTLHLNGKDITPTSRPDIISRFDATLMGMYVGRTKLELDIDADDVRNAAEAKYD